MGRKIGSAVGPKIYSIPTDPCQFCEDLEVRVYGKRVRYEEEDKIGLAEICNPSPSFDELGCFSWRPIRATPR